jgi:tRNA pseudouridine38-40 synthase
VFNYKFTLEYNGADFFGSQRQDKHRTVQGELESALSKFLKVDIESNFAGRTDAGVHAIGQVVNFKIPFELELAKSNPTKLLISLNSQLPKDMVLTKVEMVAEDFHARYSAKSREYMYKIFNRSDRPVLRLDSLMWLKETIDIDKVIAKSKSFMGELDATKYSKDCEAESMSLIQRSEIIVESKYCFKYFVKANKFYRHMVRRMVGDLLFDNPNYSAPAEGLTLIKVDYS